MKSVRDNWWRKEQKSAPLFLPVFVYEGVKGHAVLPAGGEVCDVDIGIPEKKEGKSRFSKATSICELGQGIGFSNQSFIIELSVIKVPKDEQK